MIPGFHFADVSQFQGTPDWNAYVQSRQAAIARTGFGLGLQDASWPANRDAMRAAGIPVRGWYHFLRADQDPIAQANVHAQRVGALQPGEFNMLDWELYQPTGGWPSQAQAEAFCARVDQVLGGSCWVYSDTAHAIAGRVKITASYGAQEPGDSHAVWQHTNGVDGDTSCQPAPGLVACDCNVFHGALADLQQLVGVHKEIDMVIFQAEDGAQFVFNGRVGPRIDGTLSAALVGAGVPVVQLPRASIDGYLKDGPLLWRDPSNGAVYSPIPAWRHIGTHEFGAMLADDSEVESVDQATINEVAPH